MDGYTDDPKQCYPQRAIGCLPPVRCTVCHSLRVSESFMVIWSTILHNHEQPAYVCKMHMTCKSQACYQQMNLYDFDFCIIKFDYSEFWVG